VFECYFAGTFLKLLHKVGVYATSEVSVSITSPLGQGAGRRRRLDPQAALDPHRPPQRAVAGQLRVGAAILRELRSARIIMSAARDAWVEGG
jgi:hypothetical protein